MKTKRKYLFYLLPILVLLPLWGASIASAESVLPKNKVPGSVESTTRRLTNALRKQGFEVARGYFRLYTLEDCDYSYEVMESCFLNNPAAPYVLPVMPSWPDEWVDPATVNAFGPTPAGYNTTYRLDRRESIVILGQLPPPAKYFGLQSYLITRQGDYDETSDMYKLMSSIGKNLVNTFFHYIPGNRERIITFDSLSNSNNNVVIDQQSGSAFDQLRYFIITPDQNMESTVRQAFAKIAIDQKDIFTEGIPANMRTGLDEEADEFLTLMRYAMPDKGEDPGSPAYAWRNRLPLVVLRIRPTQSDQQPVSYPPVVLENRQAVDEFTLEQDLNSLVSAVFARWGQAYNPILVKKQIDFQSFFEMVGPLCEQIGMDCLGDTQDASYQARPEGFKFDFGEVYAYVGVLGTETGNATYSSLGVNNSTKKLGVLAIPGETLKDSAIIFDDLVNNARKFFVHYFARSCIGLEALTGGNCTEITPEMIPICADPTDASCVRAVFTERDYIFPGTRRGPASEFLLPARVIQLQDPRP